MPANEGPKLEQRVAVTTLTGTKMRGTIVCLVDPINGCEAVKVAVLREDHLFTCLWFPSAAAADAAMGVARWQACWPVSR